MQKEKLQSIGQKVCVRQMPVSAVFLLNKIMVPIIQIIHIQNKTLDHCINRGLQRRSKVQTHLQDLVIF